MRRFVFPTPRYSGVLNRNSTSSRRDARIDKIKAALEALKIVASADPDRAKAKNGIGFNRADATKGHSLASMSAERVAESPSLTRDVLSLAKRYRRQVPERLNITIGSLKQEKLI